MRRGRVIVHQRLEAERRSSVIDFVNILPVEGWHGRVVENVRVHLVCEHHFYAVVDIGVDPHFPRHAGKIIPGGHGLEPAQAERAVVFLERAVALDISQADANGKHGADIGRGGAGAAVELKRQFFLNALNGNRHAGIWLSPRRAIIRLAVADIDLAAAVKGIAITPKKGARMPNPAVVFGSPLGAARRSKPVFANPKRREKIVPLPVGNLEVRRSVFGRAHQRDILIDRPFPRIQSRQVFFKHGQGLFKPPRRQKHLRQQRQLMGIGHACGELRHDAVAFFGQKPEGELQGGCLALRALGQIAIVVGERAARIAFLPMQTRQQQMGTRVAGVDLQCPVCRGHRLFPLPAHEMGFAQKRIALGAAGIGAYRLGEVGEGALVLVPIFQKNAPHAQVGVRPMRIVVQHAHKSHLRAVGQMEPKVEMADARPQRGGIRRGPQGVVERVEGVPNQTRTPEGLRLEIERVQSLCVCRRNRRRVLARRGYKET